MMKKLIMLMLCVALCGCTSVIPVDKGLFAGMWIGESNNGMMMSLNFTTNNTYELSKPFHNDGGTYIIKGNTIEFSRDGLFTFEFSNNNTTLVLSNTAYNETWELVRKT